MKKRILSIMLALVMIVSLLPMDAFATEAKCPGQGETHTAANCDSVIYENVKPTCNGFGYDVNQCEVCGDRFVTNITQNKGECNADGVVAPVAATCTTDGVVGGTYCTVCEDGKADAEKVIPAGHKWDTTAEADCTKGLPCTVCGEFSEPTAHKWVLKEINEDPNHKNQTEGTATYVCEVCGKDKEVDILVHEHEFTVNAEKAPSCFETGVLAGALKCAYCDTWQYVDAKGKTKTTQDIADITLPMVDHTEPVASELDITPADCVAKTNGVKKYTCTVCNKPQEETLKWEDAHAKVIVDSHAPTCTEYGFENWNCTKCGLVGTEKVDPDGHTPEKKSYYPFALVYKNVVEKTRCDMEGYTGDVYCTVCGEIAIKGEVIPATEHSYVAGSDSGNCVTPSSTFMVCETKYGFSKCGAIDETTRVWGALNPEKHRDTTTKNWTTSVNATCCTDGIEYHKCDDCGETWEVVLTKLNHNKPWGGTYMVKDSTFEATCTAEGYELWKCTYYNCGYTDENGNPATYTEKRNVTEKLTHETVYDMADLPDNCVCLNTVVPVSCEGDGLYTYKCNDCGDVFLVTEAAHHTIPVDGNGDPVYTEAPRTADCENPGFTGTYVCAISTCGKTIEGEEIPALKHDFDPNKDVAAVPVNCETKGYHEGGFCKTCENWLIKNADGTFTDVGDKADTKEVLAIPARGHWMVVSDKYWVEDFDAATEPGYLYKHYECNHGCGYEYISDDFHRHVWVEDETLAVEATCTTAGSKTLKCECGRVKVERIERLFHTYNGEKLVNICANQGIACDRCDKVMNAAHTFGQWIHEDANCVEGEHEIRFCEDCDAYEVTPFDDELNPTNHKWGDPVFVEDTGVYVRHCVYCGVKNPEKMVEYTPVVEDQDLTVGSIFTVDVVMNANNINIWGFDIDVLFDNNHLEFVDAKGGSNFGIVYHNNGDYISVAGNANGQAAVITDVVVTLTFKVKAPGYTYVFVDHISTATPDGKSVDVTTDMKFDIVNVYEMGDVNKDYSVDIFDVLYIYNYCMDISGEFTELGDLNGDGAMDTTDMALLYNIIITD